MPKVLHAPCTSCGRPMATRSELLAGGREHGVTQYGARGECSACVIRQRRLSKRGGVRS